MATKVKEVLAHPNPRDARQVEVMSSFGASPEHIAAHLGISTDALQLHYASQLENGPAEANLRVAQTFFDMATSGDFPQVTIAWLKMRAGWSEAPQTTQTVEDETVKELAKEKLLTLLNRGK